MKIYAKDVVKEFALQRLRLTSDTLGKGRADVPSVVRSMGGLQYGGHLGELLNRFENFQSEWFDYWYENHTLIDGHVLRGALRIVHVEEYPYFFRATRSVARRRKTYHKCPLDLTPTHFEALRAIEQYGPFTPSEFDNFYSAKHSLPKGKARTLLCNLYNYGKVARMGGTHNKPLYHVIEKLPYELNLQVNEDEAKQWLFLKCLTIYGPFSLEDISHWVGWTLAETREISTALSHEEVVTAVKVEGQRKACFAAADDISVLDSPVDNLPEHSIVRVLFNDDALLLGYYNRLASDFGYDWRYPQLSEGVVWCAAILYGRQIIGEAIIDMYAHSSNFTVKDLTLRREFATDKVLLEIEEEFTEHSTLHDKTLLMRKPRLIDKKPSDQVRGGCHEG